MDRDDQSTTFRGAIRDRQSRLIAVVVVATVTNVRAAMRTRAAQKLADRRLYVASVQSAELDCLEPIHSPSPNKSASTTRAVPPAVGWIPRSRW